MTQYTPQNGHIYAIILCISLGTQTVGNHQKVMFSVWVQNMQLCRIQMTDLEHMTRKIKHEIHRI